MMRLEHVMEEQSFAFLATLCPHPRAPLYSSPSPVTLPSRSLRAKQEEDRLAMERQAKSKFESDRAELERQYQQRLSQLRGDLEDEERAQKRKMQENTDLMVMEYRKQMEVREGKGKREGQGSGCARGDKIGG